MYFQVPSSNVRVLGSFHFAPRGGIAVPQWAKEAYAWCDTLVMEHEASPIMERMAADVPLDRLVRPELWTALTDVLPDELSRQELQGLKPWAASMTFSTKLLDREPGIEPHFHEWAAKDAKAIAYLESADEFVTSVEAIPLADVERSLAFALANRRKAQANLVQMHSAWRQRDPKRLLATIAGTPMASLPGFRAGVLTRRNEAWATKIAGLLGTSQRTLVVVGALHLFGAGKLEQCLGLTFVPVPAAK